MRIPKTVDEALRVDRENENTAWYDAVHKYIRNVRKEFQKGDKPVQEALSVKKLVGYQNIGCHMIFYVKIGGHFTRRARLFSGGHTADPP